MNALGSQRQPVFGGGAEPVGGGEILRVGFQQFSFALLERIGHRRQCRVFYRRRHGGEFARGRFRLACLLDDVVGEIHGYKITRLSRWITSS